mmetsp:Transcript_12763/g.29842  ORF Transcript_12763/g.29842 Transcript_12763/m.29842 type:complete len:209 (-) Transcript_12763:148-774(-)
MSDTRLEAVPPGEHPTRHNPKNKALPCDVDEPSSNNLPITNAVRGITMNWHKTPTGTAARSFLRTTVKSSLVSVKPVPHMTRASIRVMRSPLFVQRKRDGRKRASIAPPNTKNGKPDVKVARIVSSRLLPTSISCSSPSRVSSGVDEAKSSVAVNFDDRGGLNGKGGSNLKFGGAVVGSKNIPVGPAILSGGWMMLRQLRNALVQLPQ